jgi:Trk K+ transport system NAD-binding subunit
LVGLISIACSSYIIIHSERLYILWKPLLKYFDRKGGQAEIASDTVLKNHVILVGAHRLGRHLIATLEKSRPALVIVDINPDVTSEYAKMGLTVVCGDITEGYIQDQVNLAEAKVIISTVPDFQDNLALLEAVKIKTAGRSTKPKLIFAAQTEAEARKLYEQEIDYALSPHFISGLHLAKILSGTNNFEELKALREEHLKIIRG